MRKRFLPSFVSRHILSQVSQTILDTKLMVQHNFNKNDIIEYHLPHNFVLIQQKDFSFPSNLFQILL